MSISTIIAERRRKGGRPLQSKPSLFWPVLLLWIVLKACRGHRARALPADDYRRQGRNLFKAGADGVYIFNMFTSRESAPWNEPPFGVLKNLAP